MTHTPAPGGATERFTRRIAAAAEDPRVAAAEGLLGLADRADAAELALAPGVRSSTSSSFAAAESAVDDALDLALRRLLEQQPATVPAVPVGPAAPAVRPSTDRPEFTALLDQLRAGTDPVAAPVPTLVAALPAQRPAPAPAASPVPAAYLAAAAPAAPPEPAARVALPTRDRREDPRLAADRRALRDLGLPAAWTRGLRPGDRFTAVLRMLERMPEVDFDAATRVVAVVGPAASATLEAHRTALDLPVVVDGTLVPRSVVRVPAASGAERASALAEARFTGDVVVAVEADGAAQVPAAVEALQAVGAGAVLAVVAAGGRVEHAQNWLDALGQVDALVVEGALASAQPAAMLQLGLPVVRLDGVAVDRHTWTALLCAHLARTVAE